MRKPTITIYPNTEIITPFQSLKDIRQAVTDIHTTSIKYDTSRNSSLRQLMPNHRNICHDKTSFHSVFAILLPSSSNLSEPVSSST